MNKVKITVVFYIREDKMPDLERMTFFKEPQEKMFASIDDCIMWCRKNYKKIHSINDFRTFGEPISHFDVMDAINGVNR